MEGNPFNKLPRNLVQLEVEETTKYKTPHIDQYSLAGGVVCMRVHRGGGGEKYGPYFRRLTRDGRYQLLINTD